MNEPVVVDKSADLTVATGRRRNEGFSQYEAMKQWFTAFGDKYDTQGTTRTFTTPSRKRAQL